jgi:hypothetical protein
MHTWQRLFFVIAFSFALHTASPARAQCDDWASGFELAGTSNRVNALATFDDGSGPVLAIGGFFHSAGPTLAENIVAWDGSSFRPLGSGGSGVNGEVHSLCVFDDGTGPALYVGGIFSIAGGSGASCVAKWNGTSWSTLGTGLGSYVYALAVYDDGSGPALYAGGAFTTATGAPGNYIARWNGSSWSALASSVGGIVHALCAFDGGSGAELYAAGGFNDAGGNSASHVARWNGSSWSALGSGVDLFINTMCTHDDGSGTALIAGGTFFFAGGVPAQRVARWNGSSWSALSDGIDEDVYALASYDDGAGPALYTGTLSPASNVLNYPSRWNGSSWTHLSSGLSPSTSQSTANVLALAVFDEGTGPRLIAGGWFGEAGGVDANNVAGWDGTSWKPVGHGAGIGGPFDSSVAVSAIAFDDGSGPGLYVGGSFTSAGGVAVHNVARWKSGQWSAVGDGVTNNGVQTFAVFDDGGGKRLYAAGSFTTIGGVDANHIARWSGTEWERLDSGLNGIVRALAVFDDGSGVQLYAGGEFTLAGDVFSVGLARWNGSEWSAIDTGLYPENYVSALCVFDDGTGPALYVGGGFSGDGAHGLRYLSRWNGGSSWTNVGTPPDGDVLSLVALDDGTGRALYAGGSFYNAGGVVVSHVAKWNGTAWSALGSGTSSSSGDSFVTSLAAFDDGSGPELYAGGFFMSAGGVTVNRIARWDGSTWSALANGVGGLGATVRGLVVFEDGVDGSPDLFALGTFSQSGPLPGFAQPSFRIAQWRGCGRPGVRVCNGDGSIAACPCGNTGLPGRGCQNSASTGGATLLSAGWTSLAFDSLKLTSSGELPSALSIFLQGSAQIAPANFGDGLRCAGGALKRLYVKNASGGVVSAPTGADAKVSVRSAALGDPISIGTNRVYQVYYRDPSLSFCPSPAGNSWNVSNGLRIGWLP